MSNIGRTLFAFYFSSDRFAIFPTELWFLHRLNYLTVAGIPFSRIPANAFQGLESSLTNLDLSYSQLEKIPGAICSLVNLKSLSFNSSPKLSQNDYSIFEGCHSYKMDSVSSLTLIDNNLAEFPDIFSFFPNLKSLTLNQNNISLIRMSPSMFNASLTELSLTNNRFVRIPASINMFTDLKELHFEYNQIFSLEDYDLFRLRELTTIGFGVNPIVYVSPVALKENTLLNKVDFSATKLDQIPEAVISLPKLQSLFVSGAPIQCSCSDMLYLESWNLSSIYVDASCSTGQSVKSYIIDTLPTC